MFTKAIPKHELITLIEMKCGQNVTKIQMDALMDKLGDLVNDDKIIKHNKKRDELYRKYS